MTRPSFTSREQGNPISSVDRALDILEAFTIDQPEMALGELAMKTAMGKSTVHKLLQTLGARGYIAQDPETRRYRLGLGTWHLGATAVSGLNVRQVAVKHLRKLAVQTGEEILLWVLEGGYAVCLERMHSSKNRLQIYTDLGSIERPEELSAGRCLLAYADQADIDAAIEHAVAAEGETGRARLLKRLQWIRESGYDVNTGELWHHIRAVSAPVRDSSGAVVASITISGPDSRFDFAARERVLGDLLETGSLISSELGYRPALQRARTA